MRSLRLRFAVAACLAVLAGACAAPSRVESNKSQNYTAEPKRLFVFTEFGTEWGAAFRNGFHSRFTAIMADCKVAAQVVHMGPLDIDQKARVEQMKRFKPDTVLSIRRSGGTKDQYGTLIQATFDARLTDVKTEAIVWRSNSTVYRGGLIITAEDKGRAFAVDLTNKLKQDQVFRTCAVIAPST